MKVIITWQYIRIKEKKEANVSKQDSVAANYRKFDERKGEEI